MFVVCRNELCREGSSSHGHICRLQGVCHSRGMFQIYSLSDIYMLSIIKYLTELSLSG